MNGRVAAVLIMSAFGAGYWAGQRSSDDLHGRVERRRSEKSPESRYALRLAAEEREALQSRLQKVLAQIEALRGKLERYEPSETDAAEPAPGTRLEDGRIVGGARWNEGFNRLATGFLDSMLGSFIQRAKLSPEQERRVRSLILKEAGTFMQVSADFTNGDIDGEAAYERLEGLATDLRGKVGELLDDEQRANFGNLQQGIRKIMRRQVVSNEMTTLKSTLGLDPDQEKKIRAIVEERYARVEEGISIPIPNVLFKPLRREQDQPIYDETADAIRAVLTLGQTAKYNAFESSAPDAPFDYRAQLVPK